MSVVGEFQPPTGAPSIIFLFDKCPELMSCPPLWALFKGKLGTEVNWKGKMT